MSDPRLGTRVFTREEIQRRVEEVAHEIDRDYRGERPVLIVILRGAVYFAVDLTRALTIPFDLDFMALSPFRLGLRRAEIEKDVDVDLKGRHVLILEDIVDTGLTLNFLVRNLERRLPRSVRVCSFLNCPVRRIAEVEVHYFCFEIPDIYVVGYGLDFRGDFRNLQEVYALYDPSGRSTQVLKQMGKGR
ncbi:hypoxanthine phosphoribosyltransferase [Candidatus Caldatribacterium sp. SIUC1]|uniref:hypoxanthine phosphoribosyltransferase n=1 Tax=Candidatus Caldatribacterium sp. SIUC1 TaxID=3418365 RepID=UPI003F68DF08